MKKDAKIYLAGHKGLVGSAILRSLRQNGYTNIVLSDIGDFDLRRQAEVEDYFERQRPEYVLIAAAKVGGILANNTYKAEFIYDNLTIATNMINAAHKYGVKKLLNLGSSCIYPKLAPQPMKEDYLLIGPLEPTNEPYAIAKIAAIKLCRYFNEQYGTNFISVMPTNQYGPYDNFNLETAHVLPAIIRKVHLAKLFADNDLGAITKDINRFPLGFGLKAADTEETVRVLNSLGIYSDRVIFWGTGSPYREFLYVDDLADACIFLMANYNASQIGEFINIGSGEDLQIKALVEIVRKVVGYKGNILWDDSRPDGTPKKLLDVSRLKSLGWQPRVPLEEGIARVYAWYRKEA